MRSNTARLLKAIDTVQLELGAWSAAEREAAEARLPDDASDLDLVLEPRYGAVLDVKLPAFSALERVREMLLDSAPGGSDA